MSCLICVNNFTKSYNNFVAVQNLTFRLEPGQILGLIGPNGAGKTTTLRVLSGIIPPSSGTLCLAGHDIVTDPVKAKQSLGYIPDEPRLFDNLTVWEHLELFSAAYGVAHDQMAFEALLQYFSLGGKRNHVVQSLSRGMRQKVAIACAYVHDPKVLLFDEPLTGLDPAGIRSIKESMRERAAQGAAVMISSHLLGLVESLCTHVLLLHQGQCRYFGRIDDALQAFDKNDDVATLEDVFFSITHANDPERE